MADTAKRDEPHEIAKRNAQRLCQQAGGYRPAAKALGKPAWAAQLWRLLNENDFKPSTPLQAALGEPMKHVTAPLCPCGDVHVRATCKQGRVLARRRRSAEPAFLRFVQEVTVPFLERRRDQHTHVH